MVKLLLKNIEALKQYLRKEIGASDWHLVTQSEINMFADATGDHQWIHVDVERAKRESPYGGPIAHGYYTLSLAPVLMAEIFEVQEKKMGVNYGTEKVRFPSPVPIGKKVRMRATLLNLTEIQDLGVQANFQLTFEVENQPKPACVAEVIYRYYV
ncbi:MAG TPA: MaoC family dehydratase [Candidatus Deferrimicrobium sp.]|nr:MaoC family dehydratase [Candidatus Deferrimicrobium sp.]